jgi:outer membrane protein
MQLYFMIIFEVLVNKLLPIRSILMQKYLLIILLMSSTVSFAQEKPWAGNIAFVDVEYVMSRLPETKKLEEELQATRTKLQAEYESKQKQFQQMFTGYQSNAQSMSDTARAKLENQLRAMNAELQEFPQTAGQTLENTRKLRMAPVYLNVGRAMEQIGSENGLSLIIPSMLSGNRFLLYADPGRNVSDLVLEVLGVVPAQEQKK